MLCCRSRLNECNEVMQAELAGGVPVLAKIAREAMDDAERATESLKQRLDKLEQQN